MTKYRKKIQTFYTYSLLGGVAPTNAEMWYASNDVYNHETPLIGFEKIPNIPYLDDLLPPHMEIWKRSKDKVIIISFRGTQNRADLVTDAAIPFQLLKTTDRWKLTKIVLELLHQAFPDWSYYVTGHSLGGALATLAVDEFPWIIHAREYNPAFSPQDKLDSRIDRVYNSRDPLYNLGGKALATKVVVTNLPPLEAHKMGPLRQSEGAGNPSQGSKISKKDTYIERSLLGETSGVDTSYIFPKY